MSDASILLLITTLLISPGVAVWFARGGPEKVAEQERMKRQAWYDYMLDAYGPGDDNEEPTDDH